MNTSNHKKSRLPSIIKALFLTALVYGASVVPSLFKTYTTELPTPFAHADSPHTGGVGGGDGYGDSSCDGQPDSDPNCGPYP
jgi:hypothetical protein